MRCVRALYYQEYHCTVPKSHEIRAMAVIERTPDLLESINNVFAAGTRRNLGTAFSYVLTKVEDGAATAWLLEFFQDVDFLCVTADPSHPKYIKPNR